MARLNRFSPPGMDLGSLRRWTIGTILIAAFFSLSFFYGYVDQLTILQDQMKYPVYAGLTMQPFGDLVLVPMLLFRLAPLVPLLFIPTHYLYYFQESKSVYLMQRVRNPLEIHLRSITLPILGAAVVIGAGCAVYLFYQLIYYTCTPEVLLPASM